MCNLQAEYRGARLVYIVHFLHVQMQTNVHVHACTLYVYIINVYSDLPLCEWSLPSTVTLDLERFHVILTALVWKELK